MEGDVMGGIEKLEAATEQAGLDIDVSEMLKEYRRLHPPNPTWSLIEDLQRQAMLYVNVIDQIKSGQPPSIIRKRFADLLPGASLPNPNISALLQKAFDKVSAYRRALVDVVKKYGGDLLNELSFELENTVSVGVNIGFPPSVSIAVEHSAKATTVMRF